MPAADGDHGKVPRNSLSDERILQEALTLVDEAGLEGLTTRALGRRLGVDSTAVYRHFRSKDELLSALADHIVGGGQEPGSNDGDGSLRGQLRSACLAIRRALLAHPALDGLRLDADRPATTAPTPPPAPSKGPPHGCASWT